MNVYNGGVLRMSATLLRGNTAADAGAIQLDVSSALAINRVVLASNIARYSGGAARFMGVPLPLNGSEAGVSWKHMAVVNNRAVSGGGVFWSLPLPFSHIDLPIPRTDCVGCKWHNVVGGNVATTAVRVAVLPVTSPTSTVAVASGMRIADYQPNATLRPRVGLLDAFNRPARLDNTTTCVVSISQATDPTASVSPLAVKAAGGVVTADTLVFRGNADAEITASISCRLETLLAGYHVSTAAFVTTINRCLPGWDLTTDRVCRRCLVGSYSPDGTLCKPCPGAGECEDTLGDESAEVSACGLNGRSGD